MIKIQIPATSANLGAGFDALGLALNYYNYAEMEEYDGIVIESLDGTDIPTDASNLVYDAAHTLYDICGRKLTGLRIRQTNNIPMARGLGSSSACIIAGLMGANKLMGEPMGADDLVDLSAQIEGHPDNTAPALLGGIVTAVFDGKRVQWVKQEVYTTLKFVVTVPDFELKTERRGSVCRKKFPTGTPYSTFQEPRFSLLPCLRESTKIFVLLLTTGFISPTAWSLSHTAKRFLTSPTV